ncbi:MAG: DUF2167 domain-containing protein, partial [Burkholderiales bacterium]|nr:DUF2167 domain-containing protein [Burkholderiales bacterium]
ALLSWAASAQAPEDAQARARQTWEAARASAQAGPASIALSGQAHLALPAGRLFIPQPHATRLLQAMGNPGEDPRLQGLVFPDDGSDWFMTVRYEDAGYIRDDDARDWKADELLASYREGTEASNEERLKLGAPALEILGWAQPPAYDAGTHRLVWAMKSREKGQTGEDDLGVNYNTYLLGREGYFSMNLVTGLKDLPQYQDAGQALLSALSFDEGKRYVDFNASTDKVAEYGLAALVLGVGAKKLGLLALAGAFLLKFAKLGVLVLAGAGALMARFFKRRPSTPPSA